MIALFLKFSNHNDKQVKIVVVGSGMRRCAKNIIMHMEGKPQKAFVFDDKRSLVSFSRFGTVDSVMGNLIKGAMFVEGKIARVMYLSLYRLH